MKKKRNKNKYKIYVVYSEIGEYITTSITLYNVSKAELLEKIKERTGLENLICIRCSSEKNIDDAIFVRDNVDECLENHMFVNFHEDEKMMKKIGDCTTKVKIELFKIANGID